MSLFSLLLTLAFGLLTVIYISQPFHKGIESVKPSRDTVKDLTRKISGMLTERERIIENLEELDFDYSLGKIESSAYQQMRATLMQKGAIILRILDEASFSIAGNKKNLDEQDNQQDKTGGFCPHCSHPYLESDHFCPNCGSLLKNN